ncbi:MAG: radical SAM protein [Clostridiales bacterium]|jgi:putative methyltransferase|nr:radical SAM protein [Clostridiales bacterium]
MKKNVYLIQADCTYGNSIYFPYAAGVLAAYAWQFPEINERFHLGQFIYKREDIDKALIMLDSPSVAAFSCYMWNYEYNLLLARRLKEKHRDCTIIFGGHQVPPGGAYLEEYPFIDVLLHGEGEAGFAKVLKRLGGGNDFDGINGISYRKDGQVISNSAFSDYPENYPSPYLCGLFDDMLATEKELVFNGLFESNRGCPYRCAYCDWGELNTSVRKFPIKRILDEIKWFSDNKIEYCYCSDANFGMFERDIDIAEAFIQAKQKTGFPQKFQATYAKNNIERVFKIVSRFNEVNMSKGATVSFQTMSEEALCSIGRKNISVEKYKELMSRYNEAGIVAYSEFILGLPGETYESFRDGLCLLLESGQHFSINVFNCEVLINSEMGNPEYIEKHKIKTVKTPLNQYHCEQLDGVVSGSSRIIVETSSMNSEMWLKSHMFSNCVRVFHNLGLLQCFAIFLRMERDVPYCLFYEGLLLWLEKNGGTISGKAFKKIEDTLFGVLEEKNALTYYNEKYGNLIWPLEEGAYLDIISDIDEFYDEILPFLHRWFDKDDSIFRQLLKYQQSVLKAPFRDDEEARFKYDFFGYFRSAYKNERVPLQKSENTLQIPFSSVPANWIDFAREIVWFGRKGDSNIFLNLKQSFTADGGANKK